MSYRDYLDGLHDGINIGYKAGFKGGFEIGVKYGYLGGYLDGYKDSALGLPYEPKKRFNEFILTEPKINFNLNSYKNEYDYFPKFKPIEPYIDPLPKYEPVKTYFEPLPKIDFFTKPIKEEYNYFPKYEPPKIDFFNAEKSNKWSNW